LKDFTKETDARIIIDDLLRQAGWDPSDKSQILTEITVYGKESMKPGWSGEDSSSKEGALLSADGDQIPTGRADYVLLSQNGRPLAVIEAKRSAIQPYTAKQQVLPYAKGLQAPFIFLTNGDLIYFWDYTNDDARIVNSFYSRRDLERLISYQQETMKALDHAIELGKRRFLIELPTGTGKTDLICLYLKRLLEAGHTERILFLVDREQLAKQALEAFQDILNQYGSYWLKSGMAKLL